MGSVTGTLNLLIIPVKVQSIIKFTFVETIAQFGSGARELAANVILFLASCAGPVAVANIILFLASCAKSSDICRARFMSDSSSPSEVSSMTSGGGPE